MRAHKIKHLPVTDSTNNDEGKIIGTVTQQYLAEVIRIAVIEKTFRSYRKVIREHYKPILANVAIILQFSGLDRKSTRLNSSHLVISYAVFCLKKKTKHKACQH